MSQTAPDPVQELFAFLRFASISTDADFKEPTRNCAEWLVAKLNAAGLAAELHLTPGHPIVVARNKHLPGRKTVMIYGHYDVQPVDPLELWTSPPFEPVEKDGIIYARGSTDNKGQILAHILGVAETIREQGDVPVNLIFLIEGEEEVGSVHLEEFLVKHRDDLKCDIVAVSDTGMVAPGVPTFSYGLRGIAAMEVLVKGPEMDLHSGIYGGAVANPATAIARLVATLHDANGHVQVENFYDDVAPVEAWEREAWKTLPMTDEKLKKLTGVKVLFGEAGFSTKEQTTARPTAEVNGIGGGYQGQGSKTVLPSKAFAKLTFRLVPKQDPAKILDRVAAHLRQHCPPGVELELSRGHSGDWYLTDPHSKEGCAAQRALEETFGSKPALIREGGSIPIVQTFKRVLGVETLLLGLALPDCRAHSPNENFPVENLLAGIRMNRALLRELAKS
ncbi:peptidase M20 [Verrucomicrobia bacterium SCGC AG-212-E04]|nr:peptidase M20 [Verrucomicrobia bacterium SCGC AG-212-E04]